MFDSDYDPDDYAEDDEPKLSIHEPPKIKYINVDKYKDLVNKIRDKIISLQDEIIAGINGTRAVDERDIARYSAMVEVLKAMIN
jgi:hypothetical protein